MRKAIPFLAPGLIISRQLPWDVIRRGLKIVRVIRMRE